MGQDTCKRAKHMEVCQKYIHTIETPDSNN